MNKSNNEHYNHLFQHEDKTFKALMIFNLIRMILSSAATLLSFNQLIQLMKSEYLFYGVLTILSFVVCVTIIYTTVTLNKKTLICQATLMVLTVLVLCYNMALGGEFQIPFMDIAMTYVIFKYKHCFVN